MNKPKEKTKQNDFSIKLKEYINNSDIPVYKLAQMTGLGRTSIQHTMSGNLFPTKEFLDKLILALYLTPKQKIELYDLYQQEKIGKGEYYNRHMLKLLIEEINDNSYRSSTVYDNKELLQNEVQPYSIINGEKAVSTAISQCIGSTPPRIYNFPHIYLQIFHISQMIYVHLSKTA